MGLAKRLMVGLAFVGMTPACTKLEAARIAYTQLVPAGDHFVAVGGVPETLTGHQRLERLAVLSTEGRISHAVDERAKFAVAGVTPEVIWVSRSTNPRGLEARALDTLKPAAGITEAITAHDALAATFEVKGTHDGRAVLAGPDGKSYAVYSAGGIAELGADAAIVAPPPNRALGRDALVLGADTQDALVLDNTFAAGAPTQTLSRVAPDGAQVWTHAVADLAAPVGVKEAKAEVVDTARIGDGLWVLARASAATRYQGEDHYDVEHRLVRIDPSTGEILASHAVVDGT